MKSLLGNITGHFNQRTKNRELKSKNIEVQSKFLDNGETARKLLANQDFALLFNLYRFSLLERLEDSATDEERVKNAHYVAGVRDFIDFVEQTVYLSNAMQAEIDKSN